MCQKLEGVSVSKAHKLNTLRRPLGGSVSWYQMLAVRRAKTRPGVIKELAIRFCCSEDLIRHIRRQKWITEPKPGDYYHLLLPETNKEIGTRRQRGVPTFVPGIQLPTEK